MVDLLVQTQSTGSTRGKPVADSAVLKQLVGQRLDVSVQQVSTLTRSPLPDVLLHSSAEKIQPQLELLLTVNAVDQKRRQVPLPIRAGSTMNFNVGDRLILDVLPGKRLVLQQWLKAPVSGNNSPSAQTSANVTANQGTAPNRPVGDTINSTATTANPPLPALPNKTKRLIDALRQTLPRQISASDTKNSLQQLQQAVAKQTQSGQSLSSALSNANSTPVNNQLTQLLLQHRDLQNTVSRILKSIPSPDTLTDPHQIKSALRNSGVHFESKLATLSKANALTADPSSGTEGDRQSPLQIAQQLLADDRKGQLLRLVNQLRALSPALQAAQNDASEALKGSTDKPATLDLLPLQQLWQWLSVAGRNPNRSALGEDEQALQQLLRFALASINRVQSTQLQSLIPSSQTVDHQLQTSWVYEFPLWWNDKADTVWLKIDRDRNNSADTHNNEHHTWRVSLKFDLDELGELFVSATLQNKSMVASLWASEQRAVTSISRELESVKEALENQGIRVSAMQCHHGKPQHFDETPNINLLDTRT